MAITKERLEELIEQGAIIYRLTLNNRIDCRRLRSKMKIVDNCLYLNYKDPHIYSNSKWWYSVLDRLFEYKEDAEWNKEFASIKRIEEFYLPTWEELNQNSFYSLSFNNPELCLYRVDFDRSRETITIEKQSEEYLEYFTEIQSLEFTKENYYQTCKLAKSLFLGERND